MTQHKNRHHRDRVRHILATGDNDEKAALLDQLRESGNISMIPLLVEYLEKEKSRVLKERILLVLDALLPQSNFQEADSMLRSPDPFVRNGIVEIIKNHRVPIIRFLEKLAEDPDKDVRKFVIDALSREQSEEAIAIIRRRLDDPEVNILYTAIEYLGNFEDRASAEKIEKIILESTQLMVICSGLEALAKIDHSPSREKIFKRFMGSRVEPLVTFPMLKYIGTFGTEALFPSIQRLIEINAKTFTKEIVDCIENLMKNRNLDLLPPKICSQLEAVRDKTGNSVDKYSITKLLVRSSDLSPAGRLIKLRAMLEENDEVLRLCAVELLADAGDRSDIDRLEGIAENTDSTELQEAIGDSVMTIYQRLEETGHLD